MTTALIITLLLQTVLAVPRSSIQNPTAAYPVAKNLQKDYGNLWQRFVKGKEDDKVMKDADKLLKKNPDVVSLIILEAYIDLYARRANFSETKFQHVLKISPQNKIALSYLSDFAFSRDDYRRAYDLYSRLLAADPSRTDVEPKQQKALLSATQELIGSASAAEQAGQFQQAEAKYNEALELAPHEPSLYERLGELYARQMRWETSIQEFRKAEELSGPSDEIDRNIADNLVKLGRAEEARGILERLKKSGSSDEALETKVNELEDLGRWGSDLPIFREIQAANQISRSQFAVLLVRYFPQLTDSHKPPVIMTDVADPLLLPSIQIVVGNGLMDVRPNRTFQPFGSVTRGEFASALGRLIRLLSIPAASAPPIPLTDVAPSNARYREIQQVLSRSLLTIDDSGNFNVTGTVSGKEAVGAVTRVLQLSRG